MPAITLADLTLKPVVYVDGNLKGMAVIGPDNADLGTVNFNGKRWSFNGEEFRGIRRPLERAVKAHNDRLKPKLITVEDFVGYPNDTRPSVTLKVGDDNVPVTGFQRSPAPIITDLDDPDGEQFDVSLTLNDGRVAYVDYDTSLTVVPTISGSVPATMNVTPDVHTPDNGAGIW